MQVNTTKHQTWHSKSPNNHKSNVNKSYHITTEVGDEYEDDMYEDTEDENTEDKYKEDEYNNSRQRGQGSQQWLENQLAYYRKREFTEDKDENSEEKYTEDEYNNSAYQSGNQSANLLAYQSGFQSVHVSGFQSGYAQRQGLQKKVSEQNNQALSAGEIQNLLGSESGQNYFMELLE